MLRSKRHIHAQPRPLAQVRARAPRDPNVTRAGCRPRGTLTRRPFPSRWKNRSKTLLAELAALDSDVLAVQEMDQYDDFWAPWLTARGYAGSWKCRTQLTANKKDGCGLFFKSDRFELLAQRHIEFNDIAFGRPVGGAAAAAVDAASARETPDDPESLDDARRALVRDCVGTLALLRANPVGALPVLVASAPCSGTPRTRTSNRRRRVDCWRRRRISFGRHTPRRRRTPP